MNTKPFQQVIDLFVKKQWRDRLSGFLAKSKRHSQLVNEFHSSCVFNAAALIEIPGAQQNAADIYAMMNSLGAENECFDILEILDGDDSPKQLQIALDEKVGFLCETVLFCPKSKIGYFEGGHAKDRFILKATL